MIVFQSSVNRDEYDSAICYLKKSPTATRIILFHEQSDVKIHVAQSLAGTSPFDNEYRSEKNHGITEHHISWNPFSGLEGPSGVLSPAIAHAHELVHAYLHIIKHTITEKARMEKKQSIEEAYIIVNYENKMANELGEPIRKNDQKYFRVEVQNPIPPMIVVKHSMEKL